MHFEPLDLKHISIVKPYLEQQPFELSAYSLVSVFTWRKDDSFQAQFCIENARLFLLGMYVNRPEESYLALPVPIEGFSPEQLSSLLKDTGIKSFCFVPEDYISSYGEELMAKVFLIQEQDEYSDYVYKTEDLVNLSGRHFSKKRNLISQFNKNHLKPGHVSVQPIDSSIKKECIDFINAWYESKERSEQSNDRLAALRTINEFSELELTGIVVRINGEIAGLSTCGRLNDSTGIQNLEMALAGVHGLYQFLDRECAAQLFKGRFEYISKESDMGLAGLRRSKHSYFPIKRVRCYKLSLIE